MDKNAKIRIGIATLLIAALVTTLALHFTAAQSPSVSSGYTIDGDSVHWELENKGRITVTPHTSHGRWDAMRYQTIEFESYLGTVEEVTCGLAFNERPIEYGLSLQKEHVVQYPLYNPVTNETLGYDNVTESYWQDVTSQLITDRKGSKFFGYGTFTVPAIGKKIFQARYILNESDPIVDGKRKWEMRCWQGSFANPTWEINLDPWADNLSVVAFYSFDANNTNSTHALNWQNTTLGDARLKGVVVNQSGKFGEAYNFTGVTDVMVESTSTMSITGAADRTFGAWIWINRLFYRAGIVGWGCLSDTACGIRSGSFLILGTNPVGQLYFYGWAADCGTGVALPANSWQHVVASVNNSGQTINLYHNGTKVANCTGTALSTDATQLGIGDNTSGVYDVIPDAFNGTIDDVFVFAETLSDSQIAAIYANGTASLWSAPGNANESAGRAAIVSGIAASTASSGTTYTDRKIYIYYLNGTQKLGTFDKVLSQGSQRWLFNYNTTGENYTNMANLAPAIYVWENTSLTADQITVQVRAFINSTDT